MGKVMITLFRRNLTRMSLFCWLTVFLVLPNLQPQGVTGLDQGVTGLGQGVTEQGQGLNGHGHGAIGLLATGPPLNCGVFSTGKLIDLTPMSLFDQEKMLNRFVACIGNLIANSFLDIDGFYFLLFTDWYGKSKRNGLMAATILGFNDLARTLIHYDAKINVRNEQGATTLHFAAITGNTNMVGILLGLGAHVNGVDNYGYTPLHIAAGRGHVSTVRLLLEKGADTNARDNARFAWTHSVWNGMESGWTALEHATRRGHTEVVALLQSSGR